MFFLCHSLQRIPDISKWNLNNCYVMIQMFTGCESLATLPDIGKLINPFIRTYFMLHDCFNLIHILDYDMMVNVEFGDFFH